MPFWIVLTVPQTDSQFGLEFLESVRTPLNHFVQNGSVVHPAFCPTAHGGDIPREVPPNNKGLKVLIYVPLPKDTV